MRRVSRWCLSGATFVGAEALRAYSSALARTAPHAPQGPPAASDTTW
jgi:hypothetical protein